jgi:hypothetical protein
MVPHNIQELVDVLQPKYHHECILQIRVMQGSLVTGRLP